MNTKKANKMAIGLFLVLSVVVFGSILYTCFTCVDNEIISVDADADYAEEGARVGEYRESQTDFEFEEAPTEVDPGYWKGIDRGYMVLLPD